MAASGGHWKSWKPRGGKSRTVFVAKGESKAKAISRHKKSSKARNFGMPKKKKAA